VDPANTQYTRGKATEQDMILEGAVIPYDPKAIRAGLSHVTAQIIY